MTASVLKNAIGTTLLLVVPGTTLASEYASPEGFHYLISIPTLTE